MRFWLAFGLWAAQLPSRRRLVRRRLRFCTAIRWLNDPGIANRPENKPEWYFAANERLIKIITPPEKLCYAQFELSITFFLRGKDADAQGYADAGRKTCGDHLRHIEAELKPELKRLSNERPELADRSRSYRAKFLDF